MTLALAHIGTLVLLLLIAGFGLGVYLAATHRVVEAFAVAVITLIAAIVLWD